MMECKGSIKKQMVISITFMKKGKNIEFFMVKCERMVV